MKKYSLFQFSILIFITGWVCCCSATYAQNNAIFSGGSADGFTYGQIGGPAAEVGLLPIELLSFTGKCENNNVILKWSTASEINNDYFTIERAEENNGMMEEWSVVGKVKGAGNSFTTNNYEFIDNQLETLNLKLETIYYRFKQIDFDGKSEYFNVISVENCGENKTELAVFPNPSSGLFYVNIEGNTGQEVLIVVRDVLGNEFYSTVVILSGEKNILAIDPSQKLAPGIYMVISTNNDQYYQSKIVIQ